MGESKHSSETSRYISPMDESQENPIHWKYVRQTKCRMMSFGWKMICFVNTVNNGRRHLSLSRGMTGADVLDSWPIAYSINTSQQALVHVSSHSSSVMFSRRSAKHRPTIAWTDSMSVQFSYLTQFRESTMHPSNARDWAANWMCTTTTVTSLFIYFDETPGTTGSDRVDPNKTVKE